MARGESKGRMLEILARNPIVEAACAKANIGRTTFYRWMREDPVFAKAAAAAMNEGREFISDAAESRLIQAIKDGSVPAITYWLKHNRALYRNRMEIGGELKVEATLSPEETQERAEKLVDLIKHHEPESGTGA